jgi:hypothetical protein
VRTVVKSLAVILRIGSLMNSLLIRSTLTVMHERYVIDPYSGPAHKPYVYQPDSYSAIELASSRASQRALTLSADRVIDDNSAPTADSSAVQVRGSVCIVYAVCVLCCVHAWHVYTAHSSQLCCSVLAVHMRCA